MSITKNELDEEEESVVCSRNVVNDQRRGAQGEARRSLTNMCRCCSLEGMQPHFK